MLTVIIAQHFVFVFMMSPFLGLGIHFMKKTLSFRTPSAAEAEEPALRLRRPSSPLFYRDPPLAIRCDLTVAWLPLLAGAALAVFARGIDEATFRCSSGVS